MPHMMTPSLRQTNTTMQPSKWTNRLFFKHFERSFQFYTWYLVPTYCVKANKFKIVYREIEKKLEEDYCGLTFDSACGNRNLTFMIQKQNKKDY